MNAFHLQTDPSLPAFPSDRVLRQINATRLAETEHILNAARTLQSETTDRAEKEFQKKRQEGFEKGLREGLLEARVHNLQTIADCGRFLSALHGQVCGIVESALRNILSELPPAERIRQAAALALESVNLQQTVVLCVNPADLKSAAALSVELSKLMAGGARVECRARDDIPPGDSVLETPQGIIRCGIEEQIEAVKSALLNSET